MDISTKAGVGVRFVTLRFIPTCSNEEFQQRNGQVMYST